VIKMPKTTNVKLPLETKKVIADAIKETLAIGDCSEVEIEITAVCYTLKAEGCVQDTE
jgi:hypothetical protein